MTGRFAWVALLVALVAALPALACEGQPGNGPFVVVGWVTDEAGRPVPGLTLALVPLTSGSGEPDYENGVYQIEERDDHQTRTNDEGLFVMPGVYDYPGVVGGRYQVIHLDPLRYPERNPFICLDGAVVELADREPEMVKVRFTAHPAGGVDLFLSDAQGRPFEGTRALLVEASGRTLIYTARFAAGRHRIPGLPLGPVKVGLLDGDLAYFLQAQAHREGQPLRRYLLTTAGRPVEAEGTVAAGSFTPLRLSLP